MTKTPRYISFILRIWLAGDGDHPEWRASLEDIATGERHGFACLEDLYNTLRAQIGNTPDVGTKKGE